MAISLLFTCGSDESCSSPLASETTNYPRRGGLRYDHQLATRRNADLVMLMTIVSCDGRLLFRCNNEFIAARCWRMNVTFFDTPVWDISWRWRVTRRQRHRHNWRLVLQQRYSTWFPVSALPGMSTIPTSAQERRNGPFAAPCIWVTLTQDSEILGSLAPDKVPLQRNEENILAYAWWRNDNFQRLAASRTHGVSRRRNATSNFLNFPINVNLIGPSLIICIFALTARPLTAGVNNLVFNYSRRRTRHNFSRAFDLASWPIKRPRWKTD